METKQAIEAPSLPGWKIYHPLPGTEQTVVKLIQAYKTLAPIRATGQATILQRILDNTIGCISAEDWMPIIDSHFWALAAEFRAAPGTRGRIKIYFPFKSENKIPVELENNLNIYTRGDVVEQDVDQVLRNLETVLLYQKGNKKELE